MMTREGRERGIDLPCYRISQISLLRSNRSRSRSRKVESGASSLQLVLVFIFACNIDLHSVPLQIAIPTINNQRY